MSNLKKIDESKPCLYIDYQPNFDKLYDLQGEIFQWTTDPPTNPGLYRAIDKDGGGNWVECVNDVVWFFGDEVPRDPNDFTHWLGPLPEPPQE